jgi:hypothetical protein
MIALIIGLCLIMVSLIPRDNDKDQNDPPREDKDDDELENDKRKLDLILSIG